MKTNTLHYAWAAGALLVFTLTGCNNENELPADNGKEAGKLMTITATQNNATTRLAHTDATPNVEGSNLTVTWKAGDAFMLYKDNAGVGQKFSTTDGGVSAASFTGTTPTGEGNTYSAFYPHSKAQQTWNDNCISVEGQVQKGATSTNHLSEYDYMVASWDGTGNLTFLRQVAVLKFIVTLPTGKYPRVLTLSTQDNSDLRANQPFTGSAKKTKQLTMKIVGTDGSDADFNSFTAYMCVLSSTPTAGKPLALSITCTDGTLYNYTVNTPENTYYALGYIYHATLDDAKLAITPATAVFNDDVVASPSLAGTGSESNPYLISSAADLKFFMNRVDNGNDYSAQKYVKLTTDIHIEAGSTWNPIGAAGKSFKGIFDGGGHTISGTMSSSAPYLGFFEALAGSVSDLHVSATLEYTGTSSGVMVGAIASNITTTSQAPVTISNCAFSGKVSLTESWTDEKSAQIGGIVGNSGYCTISYCTSMSDIDVRKKGDYLYLGGIIGRSIVGTKIYHCLNTGNMNINSTSNRAYAGGIIGFLNVPPDDMGDIQYCRNKGSINVESTSDLNYAGGIAGFVMYTNMHTSHNEGTNITTTGIYNMRGSLCGNSQYSSIYNCCTGPAPLVGYNGTTIPDGGTHIY